MTERSEVTVPETRVHFEYRGVSLYIFPSKIERAKDFVDLAKGFVDDYGEPPDGPEQARETT